MLGVLLSCMTTVGTCRCCSTLVASLAGCSGVWQVRQPERLLCAAGLMHLVVGSRLKDSFFQGCSPCWLRILSIGICYKSFTAVNSDPHSQIYKLCLKFLCLLGELIIFLVLYIQIFPYIFLVHKSMTAMIVEHKEVKIRTKAASTKSVA